jgi:aldose 1-epimerase
LSDETRHRRFGRRARIGAVSAVTAVAAAAGAFGATAASAAPAKPAGGSCAPSVSSQYFGSTIEPYTGKYTAVYRYTLSNCRGVSAKILTFGGIVQEINVPGRNGQVTDVTLGFKTLQDYVTYDSPPVTANGGPYFGESIGRYGNRIAKGTFTLDQPGVGPSSTPCRSTTTATPCTAAWSAGATTSGRARRSTGRVPRASSSR